MTETHPPYKIAYLEERVEMPPNLMTSAAIDLDSYLLRNLSQRLEGQCSAHGYIIPGSIELLARSMGLAETGRFTGNFMYTCKVSVQVLYPAAHDKFVVDVLRVNKMGAYCSFLDAMRLLLPRDLHLGDSEFDSLKDGDEIQIEMLKTRFQSHDKFINGIGRLVAIIKSGYVAANDVQEINKKEEEEKEEGEEEEGEEEEGEEEEREKKNGQDAV